MSIVIKGMDMPTSCSRCPCSNDASRFCRVVEEYIPMLGKPAFCPLVDVPDTNVGDMISRQAAIDALCKRCDLVSDGTPCAEKCNDIKILEMLPSTQPEQKKGKWVNGRCDKCNAHAPFWAMASTYYKSNFCPNCGAEMEGAL